MSNGLIGFLYLILWCLISAVARVYLSDILQKIDPFVLCFYVFLITVSFYSLISFFMSNTLGPRIQKNKYNIILINISTFGCWFFIIYPFKYMDPTIVSSLVLCINPVYTSILSRYFYNKNNNKSSNIILLYGFIFVSIYMVILSYFGLASIKLSSRFHLSISTIFILVSSFFLFINTIISKKLLLSGFNPVENNTIRFWLLVLLSFTIGQFMHISFKIDFQIMKLLIYVSFIYAIIPLYLIQLIIRRLEPITITSFTPLMPVVIFVMESIHPRFHLSEYVVLALLIISTLSIYGFFINNRTEKETTKFSHSA